ncbi:glycosyltransferase [Candidatus Uhrbacteria bacterium]|nr:glycosyltransferase [Candidatus Uhrbacteria bacterium]
MKLSFVIVSWNVRELLESCLRSIFEHTTNLSFEVIVIDNASADDSSAMVAEKFPQVKLIANDENKGFAAACNQGIKASSGEHIFFLNPDSEITESTVSRLTEYLDAHIDAGIVAPQIRGADGSIQKSIQRFPTPLSQLGILFKLRKIVPGLLSHYYADDFDYTRDEQEVDQPDGAALMIRRSVLEGVGAFDERFFLWFDEVDLCKRVHDAGYKIVYLSRAHIIHHSGKSFAQKGTFEKQRIFFTSCARYLIKHHGIAGTLTAVIMQIAVGVFALLDATISALRLPPHDQEKTGTATFFALSPFSSRLFGGTLFGIVSVELLSFASYFYGPIGALSLGLLVAATFLITFWRLEYGIAILFTELIIGSKGYLFSLTVGDATVSLRMALFAAVIAGWLLRKMKMGSGSISVRNLCLTPFLRWYVVLGLSVVWGVVAGLMWGNNRVFLFSDANAWLFFLILPVLYSALRKKEHIYRFLTVCVAAMTAQIVKVLLVFYIMGHRGFGEEALTAVYRWVRSTGVGELTQMGGMFRIFFQSHIYGVLFFFILLVFVHMLHVKYERTRFRNSWVLYLLFVGSIASLILSFSRSFWVGGGLMVIVFLCSALYAARKKPAPFLRLITTGAGSTLCALILLFVISAIPIPSREAVFSLDLLTNRIEDIENEAAAASRWNLLPIIFSEIQKNPIGGYGFGKTLTYTSKDPRVLSENATGEYTTYAFEWGYLDLWLKMGFFGLLAYLLLLAAIVVRGADTLRRLSEEGMLFDAALVRGFLFGLGALLVIHFFTPYLNHPLGIGMVMLAGVLSERLNPKNSLSTDTERRL